MSDKLSFSRLIIRLLIIALLASKDFTAVKENYLQWGLFWWSLDQESNAYQPAWHALFRESINWLLFVDHFTFWTWMIHLDSVEQDYIRI